MCINNIHENVGKDNTMKYKIDSNLCKKYSVKDTLEKYFPGDTVSEMRALNIGSINQKREDIIPLALAYTDSMALSHFLSERFLVDTVLYDEYIAYFSKSRYGDEVFLSFMYFEDDTEFPISPKQAYDLVSAWESEGYIAHIMLNCVVINNYPNDNGFSFTYHLTLDGGTNFLIPRLVNEKYILVKETMPYWLHAEGLLFSAITSGLVSEYESIFSKDAEISRCPYRSDLERACEDYKNAEPFVKGIDEIKDYFDDKNNVFIAYVKRQRSIAYSTYIISDNVKYVMMVGRSNLLVRLIEDPIMCDEEIIPVPKDLLSNEMLMPELLDVSSLNISSVHAYGLKLSFNDGCIKNYYISVISEAEIPQTVSIDGYVFDQDALDSVKLVCDNNREGVEFSNGCYIPSHILYYRGVTQIVPKKEIKTVFENDNIKIDEVYKVPLKKQFRLFINTYSPRDDEYYGAGETLIDENGDRVTDYSALEIESFGTKKQDIYRTVSESSELIGYIKKDGSWLAPPIFHNGEDFEDGHFVTVKKDDKKYLLNYLGEIIDFPYEIEVKFFGTELCPFNAGKFEGEYTVSDEDYFDDLTPGKWGFVDKYGRIAIEPQYVFTTGYIHGINRAFVAKSVDEKTLWGLIDENGNEVIPCIYPNLGTHNETAVNFQRTQYGPYGIMDFNGNVIMEPRFYSIYEYDAKHGLVAFYEDWNIGHKIGVAKTCNGEIIIPAKYEYVGFYDNCIECELDFWERGENAYDYYDYEGNRLTNDFYMHICKCVGGYVCQRDGKYGAVDENDNIIVPFLFDKINHIDYYQRGYVVTGKSRMFGLTTRDGKIILSEKYSEITISDDFIIASYRNDTNCCIIDELYLLDGTPVFNDVCRKICFNEDMLMREAPYGCEVYRISRKKY